MEPRLALRCCSPRSRHILVPQSGRWLPRRTGRVNGGDRTWVSSRRVNAPSSASRRKLRVQGQVRELVRRDFAPRRRPADGDLAGHVGSLMERVAEASLQEIDDLIAELRRRREQLLGESARVQRAIIEYAQLSQSTMQSTNIIT